MFIVFPPIKKMHLKLKSDELHDLEKYLLRILGLMFDFGFGRFALLGGISILSVINLIKLINRGWAPRQHPTWFWHIEVDS